MDAQEELKQKYLLLFPHLNGRQQRLLAAVDAERIGKGGITLVARASGFSRPAIYQARRDLHGAPLPADRERRAGAGRKKLVAQDPQLSRALEGLFEPHFPEGAVAMLSWTCQTTRQLAQSLTEKGHAVSHEVVARLLREMGFRLPLSTGRRRGVPRPDRETQFRYLLEAAMRFADNGWPVLAVEIEPMPPSPRGSHAPNRPIQDACVLTYAAEAVRIWWQSIGSALFPDATQVLLCLDRTGQSLAEPSLWQSRLQRWINQDGLEVMVCLMPPGTYRWNRSEYLMTDHFAMKWSKEGGQDCEVSVSLCSAASGEHDRQAILLQARMALAQQEPLNLHPHETMGEWNYSLHPVELV